MRRVLAASLLVISGLGIGLSASASANPVPPVPVTVTHGPDGSICVTVSLQVPTCTPGTGVR